MLFICTALLLNVITMYLKNLSLHICRGLGTEESLFNMNSGRLQASLDRIEAVFTQSDEA